MSHSSSDSDNEPTYLPIPPHKWTDTEVRALMEWRRKRFSWSQIAYSIGKMTAHQCQLKHAAEMRKQKRVKKTEDPPPTAIVVNSLHQQMDVLDQQIDQLLQSCKQTLDRV